MFFYSIESQLSQKKQAITDLLFHVSKFGMRYNPNSFWIFSTLSIFSHPKKPTSLKYFSFCSLYYGKGLVGWKGKLF